MALHLDPIVVEFEEKMRKELLKAWAAQFKQDGVVKVGNEDARKGFDAIILSPAEMFEEMKKAASLTGSWAKKQRKTWRRREKDWGFFLARGKRNLTLQALTPL